MEENLKDIAALKKNLNESRTDSDLFLIYLREETDGKIDCQLR